MVGIEAGKPCRLLLLGYGSVQKSLLQYLITREQDLLPHKVEIAGVCTRSDGAISFVRSMSAAEVLNVMRGQNERGISADVATVNRIESAAVDQISEGRYDILVENTVSTEDGESARQYIALALTLGKSVITSNKSPIAHHLDALLQIAKESGGQLKYESCVMDGFPIFNYLDSCLPHEKVTRVEGVLNSTTNYVLDSVEGEMRRGNGEEEEGSGSDASTSVVRSAVYAQALRHAQSEGIAEADPSGDVDGKDAASKLCCIANHISLRRGRRREKMVKPDSIRRTPICDIDLAQLKDAVKSGGKMKQIGRLSIGWAKDVVEVLDGQVAFEVVGVDSPFYSLSSFSSAITFHFEHIQPITLVQHNPSLVDTAHGNFSDLLALLKLR